MILLFIACCISGVILSMPVLKMINNLKGK